MPTKTAEQLSPNVILLDTYHSRKRTKQGKKEEVKNLVCTDRYYIEKWKARFLQQCDEGRIDIGLLRSGRILMRPKRVKKNDGQN